MAEIQTSTGGRKTNLELNLVPFIDLMSVLITFLLITAVWTQVSMIQIGSSIYGKKSDTVPSQPPPEVDLVLKIDIRATGYVLTVGKNVVSIPLKNGEFDQVTLLENLARAKQEHPNKADGAIAMADELPYERLIGAMDAYLKSGFSAISILTGGPN